MRARSSLHTLWGMTQELDPDPTRTIEVFADIGCPFTHVGLAQLVAQRQALGRTDVALRVRSWPLEVVNGAPLDAAFIAEEVDEIRAQVPAARFAGFTAASFPSSTMPALALAAAAYEQGLAVGERISLALRDLVFEQGVDVADRAVLARLAAAHGVEADLDDHRAVLADHREGVARGVQGSPHFFTPAGSFFCPGLDISRDAAGHLRITADAGFGTFVASCFAP